MNNLFKKVGLFTFFYASFTNPVSAMEPDRTAASSSQEGKGAYFVAYNEASSVSDVTSLSPVFEHLYYDEDWKCGICWDSGNVSKIEVLPCGHKFHRNCIEQFLAYPSGKRCPYCQQEHKLRRNIIAMWERTYLSPIFEKLENVLTEFELRYRNVLNQELLNLKKAINCLSLDRVMKLNEFLKTLVINCANSQDEFMRFSQAVGPLGMNLCNWKVHSEVITKEMIRSMCRPLIVTQVEKAIYNEDTRMLAYLLSLLEEDGRSDMVAFLENDFREKKKLEQADVDNIINFLLEIVVENLHR